MDPPSHKERISWLRFVLQLAAVALVYLAVSFAFFVPAAIDQLANPGAPPPALDTVTVAMSAIGSMAAALMLAWYFLHREGRVREALMLGRPNWSSALPYAALATGGAYVIFTGGGALAQALGFPSPDPSAILDLVTESPQALALWVVGVAWFAAGFGEEVLYRGFLTDRLERLGGLQGRVWPVLLAQAFLFGLPHAYQGASGMAVTGAVGLLLGWVRLQQRGNLWASILAHAAVDTISMSLAYAGLMGG
jgi:hypothetical protein